MYNIVSKANNRAISPDLMKPSDLVFLHVRVENADPAIYNSGDSPYMSTFTIDSREVLLHR